MHVGISQRERPPDEADVVAVKETLEYMREHVRFRGHLGVGGDIDATKGDLAIVLVAKVGAVNRQI